MCSSQARTVFKVHVHVCASLLQEFPPVRSQVGSGSSAAAAALGQKKKERKKVKKNNGVKQSGAAQAQSRIRSYDYKAWDKFDVVSNIELVFIKKKLVSAQIKVLLK